MVALPGRSDGLHSQERVPFRHQLLIELAVAQRPDPADETGPYVMSCSPEVNVLAEQSGLQPGEAGPSSGALFGEVPLDIREVSGEDEHRRAPGDPGAVDGDPGECVAMVSHGDGPECVPRGVVAVHGRA